MRREGSYIIFLLLLLTTACTGFGQKGFYIPASGKVFFNGDTATIFSDVINDGKLGIGKKAVVNFAGESWTNAATSKITDEANNGNDVSGNGGLIRFMANSFLQKIDGGYNAATRSGPVIQNFQAANPMGIELVRSSLKVSHQFDFQQGLFYINDQLLSIGDNAPGLITGYDSSKYFVTAVASGLLIREGISKNNDWITFPVGSKSFSYTPAAIRSRSAIADDYSVNVADNALLSLTTGRALKNEGINKTWQVGRRDATGLTDFELALQHLTSDEGMMFSQNRSSAYISQFTGSSWDVGYPQSQPLAGSLTTGAPLANGGVNTRIISAAGNMAYFTKLTAQKDSGKTKLWFNAFRINPSNVKVYWTTNPELNISHFIVQRRLANEAAFKRIDSVKSMAVNGFSATQLDYAINDANSYSGISYYRLMMISMSGDTTYSEIVAVGNRPGEFRSDLWPAVTSGRFYISLNTPQPAKKIIVWNVLGQKMMEQPTDGLRVVQIDAYKLAAGNYYVSIIGLFDTILETKKLIITR